MFVRRKIIKRMQSDIDYLHSEIQFYREMYNRLEDNNKYLKRSLEEAWEHIKAIEYESQLQR